MAFTKGRQTCTSIWHTCTIFPQIDVFLRFMSPLNKCLAHLDASCKLSHSTNKCQVLSNCWVPGEDVTCFHAYVYYSMFTLSWSSSTYSGSGIPEMFHPRETGCNGYVSIHENCNIECLTLHAYTFVRKRREQVHFSMLLSSIFQQDK